MNTYIIHYLMADDRVSELPKIIIAPSEQEARLEFSLQYKKCEILTVQLAEPTDNPKYDYSE